MGCLKTVICQKRMVSDNWSDPTSVGHRYGTPRFGGHWEGPIIKSYHKTCKSGGFTWYLGMAQTWACALSTQGKMLGMNPSEKLWHRQNNSSSEKHSCYSSIRLCNREHIVIMTPFSVVKQDRNQPCCPATTWSSQPQATWLYSPRWHVCGAIICWHVRHSDVAQTSKIVVICMVIWCDLPTWPIEIDGLPNLIAWWIFPWLC